MGTPMEDTVLNFREEFWKNFDLSVVMPFYKKMREFSKVLPLNQKFLQRNGIEVVIVLDTPEEHEELINFVRDYPFINWRIIMNDKPHDWRNPAKPLNVGIRFSTKKYIMVCSPESEMLTDVIYILRKSFEDFPDYQHYAIGRVCFADEQTITIDNYDQYRSIPFGSIMVERSYLEEIGGYDETFSQWGGDDNNLRSRLDMMGVHELYFNSAMMIHRDVGNEEGKVRRSTPFSETPNHAVRHYFYPESAVTNIYGWGHDFDKVIYDWKDKRNNKDQLLSFLGNAFVRHEVTSYFRSGEKYPILLLVQSYNESRRMKWFLSNVSKHVDGIILLDDESDDNTFELADDPKILFKAQKRRSGFNDLENRNLLLDLASFVNHELALFLDVDEILDKRFCDLRRHLGEKEILAYVVALIHLWNDADHYNAEYPSSLQGICKRFKMFRNIGYAQIYSSQGRLHFHQVPTRRKTKLASGILVHHYGMIDPEDRKRKYEFYTREDTEQSQSSYEHINPKNDPVLKAVSEIDKEYMNRITRHY